MVFSSPIFLFYFLPIVLLLYFCTKGHIYLQNIILAFCSFVFYFWGEKEFSILVLLSIGINYSTGLLIYEIEHPQIKRIVLFVGVCINLSILIYYKYFNFFIHELLMSFSELKPLITEQHIHLPLGISFFTFHGLTYITDIYRGDARASKSPLNVGLYTLFFPQLIAGPIVRYKDIEKQLEDRSVTSGKLNDGVKRFIIGLAKKVLIANTLGKITDDIYLLDSIHQSNGLAWLAIVCYALQIYYDFSGYSDMAIGLAKIFGFDFIENFNFPYSASSLQDFWRRWHISLSTFFRDYVYKPLGGNRAGKARTYFNLIIVFFLTGLWHGASWNFILWGLWHGLFLLIERMGFRNLLNKIPGFVGHVYTIFIVLIGWVFFRMEHLTDIKFQLKKLFFINTADSGLYNIRYFIGGDVLIILCLAILFTFPVFQRIKYSPARNLKWMTNLLYLVLFILSLCFLSNATHNPFIYYRF
jgi:alginate O-acetyltransferase complex protein AlgI